jgi:hypothetical protein
VKFVVAANDETTGLLDLEVMDMPMIKPTSTIEINHILNKQQSSTKNECD